jgi:hypothetical protein
MFYQIPIYMSLERTINLNNVIEVKVLLEKDINNGKFIKFSIIPD